MRLSITSPHPKIDFNVKNLNKILMLRQIVIRGRLSWNYEHRVSWYRTPNAEVELIDTRWLPTVIWAKAVQGQFESELKSQVLRLRCGACRDWTQFIEQIRFYNYHHSLWNWCWGNGRCVFLFRTHDMKEKRVMFMFEANFEESNEYNNKNNDNNITYMR